MIAIIDTSEKECLVGLHADLKLDEIRWLWEKDTGQEVLENMDKLLSKNNAKLSDIKKIIVCQGPGSYTGLRVGITITNTLGWTLNVPIVGYKKGDLENTLNQNVSQEKNFSKIVLPVYQ